MLGAILPIVILLPVALSFSAVQSPTAVKTWHLDAVLTPPLRQRTIRPSPSRRSQTSCILRSYGRGTEIWPPVNEQPILLSSSFPGGIIPAPAKQLLDSHSSHANITQSAATSINIIATDGLSIMSDNPSTAAIVKDRQSALVEELINPIRGGGKRRAIRRTLSHILSSAARASNHRARSSSVGEVTGQPLGSMPPPAISKGPVILALALLITDCVDLIHLLTVVGMTTYILGLASWCAAPKHHHAPTYHRTSGVDRRQHIVNMPSLPARGHVPDLVKNPLGSSLTGSVAYRTWLRMGALLGVLLPVVALTQLALRGYYGFSSVQAAGWWAEWMIVTSDVHTVKRMVGVPLFLLCCQALTEAVARTALLPLPIRILIPVAYNTLRLSSLQLWAFCPMGAIGDGLPVISTSMRALGIANLLYWYANLLFFLVPVGVVRYLRAHYFCVEAVEVTVRQGGESFVGLLP